jgi:hypothetical protein
MVAHEVAGIVRTEAAVLGYASSVVRINTFIPSPAGNEADEDAPEEPGSGPGTPRRRR